MFLVSWRLEPFESGITVSGLSRSRDHLDDLIGDIVGARSYRPYCLKWQSSPGWSEAVCCAMADFQIQLFEASTRCKTSFRTKMLNPLSVAFIAFFKELRKRAGMCIL